MSERDDAHQDERGEPTWQPVAAVGAMTGIVAEHLQLTREQQALLEQARPSRPGARVLDDHTVAETRRVYGEMATDYQDLFAEQGRRWQALPLGKATAGHVQQYVTLVDQHRQALAEILALADEISPHTIEAVMAKSDLQVGVEAFFGRGPAGSP